MNEATIISSIAIGVFNQSTLLHIYTRICLNIIKNNYKSGILMDKTMDCKLMYIPNDDIDYSYYNYWLKRLDTQLNEPTNQNLDKVSRVDKKMLF